jgi:hypothetical protein
VHIHCAYHPVVCLCYTYWPVWCRIRVDHYCNSHLYYVVIQEVEYVKKEAKIVYLLECLQKTAPPVIIFCERKSDVDDIHEYLLLKVR